MLSEQAYSVIWRAPWLLANPKPPNPNLPSPRPEAPPSAADAERRWLDWFAELARPAAAAAPDVPLGDRWTAPGKAGWLNVGSMNLAGGAWRAARARMESAAWSKRCDSTSGS